MVLRAWMVASVLALAPAGAESQTATVGTSCAPETYVVFYDRNRAELTGPAMDVISKAAAHFQNCGRATISLANYSPSVSTLPGGNTQLSTKRMRAVVESLGSNGVPGGLITVAYKSEPSLIVSHGEDDLLHRRVEITVVTSAR